MTPQEPGIPASARLVFEGSLFAVYQWEQQLFDGSVATFEIVSRPDTVYVLPLVAGRISMAWRLQPGTPPTIGFFGGRVEPGETPVAAARRELEEEAHLLAENLRPWFSVQMSPKVAWTSHVFLADRCCKSAGESDPGERFSSIDVDLDELLSLAAGDDFAHSDLTGPLLRIATDPARVVAARALFDGAGDSQ